MATATMRFAFSMVITSTVCPIPNTARSTKGMGFSPISAFLRMHKLRTSGHTKRRIR